MTGERLAWYKLASHLHSPLQFVKRTTTSSEFVDWMSFLNKEREMEIETTSKMDYYLAAIVAEIRRGQVKHKDRVSIKDCLLKFSFKTGKPITKEAVATAAAAAKKFFFALTGHSKKGK